MSNRIHTYPYFVYSKSDPDSDAYGAEGCQNLAEADSMIDQLRSANACDIIIVDSRIAVFQVLHGSCAFIIENLKRRWPYQVTEGLVLNREMSGNDFY